MEYSARLHLFALVLTLIHVDLIQGISCLRSPIETATPGFLPDKARLWFFIGKQQLESNGIQFFTRLRGCIGVGIEGEECHGKGLQDLRGFVAGDVYR